MNKDLGVAVVTAHLEPKCERCTHWRPEDEYRRQIVPDIGKCARAKMFWDVSEWDADYERRLLPEHAGDQMFVQDGSDYHAILLTRAAFFCAHFEAESPADESDGREGEHHGP